MSQREPLDMMEYIGWNTIFCNAICCDWTCDWVSQLVMVNHMLLCIDSISFPYWLYPISSILTTEYNYYFSGDLIELSLIIFSLLIIPFNFRLQFSSLNLHLEDGERRSQPYPGEYYWLGPDPMQNTRGSYILIFLVVLITLSNIRNIV